MSDFDIKKGRVITCPIFISKTDVAETLAEMSLVKPTLSRNGP
jgi:hypothetical protein